MMVSAALVGCGGPASRVTDLDYPGAEVVLNGDDILSRFL